MRKVYRYPRNINGETRQEHVILDSDVSRDLLQVVHDAAVDYCLNNENRHLCKEGGMSFGQAMEHITPEMLAPYGVTMIRLEDVAVQTDQMPPLVSQYELATIREVRRVERRRAREVLDYAERAAGRLETKLENRHPIVSTWGSGKIAVKAASWACQFVMGKETDFGKFFEKKLKETESNPAYQALMMK